MVQVMALSGVCIQKAGTNVSTDLSGGGCDDYWDNFIAQAESTVNSLTRHNWTDDYAALNDDVKFILEAAVSDLAAIYAISYDMSGFTSRIEAEDMVNILRDRALFAVSILRDKKVQKFIKGA